MTRQPFEDESLRRSLIVSAVLHVAVALTLYVGVPTFFRSPPPLGTRHVIIPFNIVDIGEITNTRIAGQEEEGQGAKMIAAPTTKPPPSAPTPDEPSPDDLALAPKPLQKPKVPDPVKQEQSKAQSDMLASVLKNVAKLKPTEQQNLYEAERGTDKTTTDARGTTGAGQGATGAGTGGTTSSGVGKGVGFGPALADRLMISEEDALRRQVSQCWNMPVGAREAENLIVEVLIEVNPDRTVRDVQIVDRSRMVTDPYFRAAAEAAVRALRHPRCNPLMLNPEKYEQWKTIRFNFDPRDML